MSPSLPASPQGLTTTAYERLMLIGIVLVTDLLLHQGGPLLLLLLLIGVVLYSAAPKGGPLLLLPIAIVL